MVQIQVYDGTYLNKDIFYNVNEKYLHVPTKSNPNGEEIPLSDILLIKKANEENIKEINPKWDLSEAYSERRSGSNWGAAFGILGIVGEVMYKGAKVVFILQLKNGMKILAIVEEKYLKEIQEIQNG